MIFWLLGPSGCGKTRAGLRIAGLKKILALHLIDLDSINWVQLGHFKSLFFDDVRIIELHSDKQKKLLGLSFNSLVVCASNVDPRTSSEMIPEFVKDLVVLNMEART